MADTNHGSYSSAAGETALQIVLPLALLIAVVVISILAVVFYSAQKADEQARSTSESNVEAVLKDRRSQLAALTKDYGYWDDTILNAFHSRNLEWIDNNIGSYLTEAFGISELLILGSDNEIVLSLQDGSPVGWEDTERIRGGLGELIDRARESGPVPVPVSGILSINDYPAMVGVAVLAPEGDGSPEIPSPRPVLILAKRFDEPRLLEISRGYGLTNLRFQHADAHLPLTEEAALPLLTTDQTYLGSLVWVAGQPSSSVLGFVKVPLVVALLLMAVLGFFVIRASLQSAQRLTEARGTTLRLSSAMDRLTVPS